MATTDTATGDVKNRVPLPALALTAAGALPFIALSIAPWIGAMPTGRPAIEPLSLYALSILSFMGAIHWGLAMGRAEHNDVWPYVASVTPALVGWFALVFLPVTLALRVMAAAFVLLLVYDVRAARHNAAPPWYPHLRVPVTVVVVAALTLASLAPSST
ncbi:MAG: DUF3429 domain-containing protein [Verrucomicrobiae bacterium]|nr:DUF3429 domain-containing protein [Verrucomicrobiae bacterium]